jgi:hypothetical protein
MAQIAPEMPTRGALRFVDTDLPLIRTLTLSGYPLFHPKRLAKRIARAGPTGDGTVSATAAALASIFVAA